MEWGLVFTILGIYALWLLISLILYWHQRTQIATLKRDLTHLERDHRRLLAGQSAEVSPSETAELAQKQEESTETAPDSLWPVEQPSPEGDPEPAKMAVADTSNTGADGENPSGAQPNDPVSADHGRGSRASSWETIITSRWMVWTGAVALVLGVTFLVKFSIDQDLFGPAARVASGLVLGVLLLGAGEWLRRRPLLQPLASVRPEYIPAAVAGAGLISLFGTLYAAHASFGMIGTIPAFLALSLVVAATIAFSLLHGRSFALFGTLAGCAVPALFPIPDPSPWGLFPYLTVLSAACLLLVRDRQWWWLGWITVSLALFWTLVWSASVDDSLDMMVAGGFLVVIAGFVVFTRRGLIPPPAHPTSFHGWLSGLFGLERFVLASLAGTSIIMLFIDGARSVWTGNHRARPWLHGNATRFGTQVSLAPGERIVRRPVCARFPDRVVA